MAGVVFLNAADHINRRAYPLAGVPCSYGVVPAYYTDNDIVPIYDPHPDEVGRARLSISHMIDMYFNQVPFNIVKEGDVFEIADVLAIYLDSFKLVTLKDREQAEFLNRTRQFHARIRKMCRALLRKNNNVRSTDVSLAQIMAENSR